MEDAKVKESPFNSEAQSRAAQKIRESVITACAPACCVVTGGSGFVGQRLVEMLVERGAKHVVSFDLAPADPSRFWQHPNIQYVKGDITNFEDVSQAVKGADCVWHLAAIVGPGRKESLYHRVNYGGTMTVLRACKRHRVPKIVMSTSPSTRLTGEDLEGVQEKDLPNLPRQSYMESYSRSKAEAELELRKASCADLLTVAVAPHNVYGPRDGLFFPQLFAAAGTRKLRVFSKGATGSGMNKVSFTHVDNYCHGLILAERALYPGSRVAGGFYIVTDGATHNQPEGYGYFWKEIDAAVTQLGFEPLWDKFKLPYWLLMMVAYALLFVGWVLGREMPLDPMKVTLTTMHRWFDISAARDDIGYEPVVPFRDGWHDTVEWFRVNWLPAFLAKRKKKED